MIGDLERSTNNNIEHQSLEFVRNTLLPYLKNWEMELNRKLLFDGEKGSYFYRFNVDGLLRGDTKSRAEYYSRALGGVSSPGWMTTNEVRELENLNRQQGGDFIYNPALNSQKKEDIDENGADTNTDTGDGSPDASPSRTAVPV
jgi:phage portal protein BeeE